MTDHNMNTERMRRGFSAPDWRWLLILGALLIVGAVVAFLKPFEASLTAVAIAAGIFALGGVLQLWIAFRDEGRSRGRAVSALMGLLILAFGIALLANPLAGIMSLTLMVAGFFLALGALRLWLGMQMLGQPGRGWIIASGAVSLVLGVLVILAIPQMAGGMLGIFLGAELLSSGIGATAMALRLR